MSIVAGLQALFDLRQVLGRDQPRGLRDLQRQPLEALGKGLEVLARQQRRRHHHGHLHAVERRDERRAQRHLRLAEADVAAHEAVHRPPRGEILLHGLDARRLILRFFIGKARDELVVSARRRRDRRALP